MYQLTIPVAAVYFNSHADSSSVVRVWIETNLACPYRRIKLPFGTKVSVLVPFDHLQHKEIKAHERLCTFKEDIVCIEH